FQAKGRPPITLSTVALTDRATLLVLTSGTGATPIRLYQFLVPMGPRLEHLSEKERAPFVQTPLKSIRFATQLERLFSQNYSISEASAPGRRSPDNPTPAAFSGRAYNALITSKYIQPVASLIVANDLLRHGVLNPRSELNARYGSAMPELVRTL